MVKISACVIVKNEAKNISKWLHSMRQAADEMIVVDTGSTDNTKEIARAGGAAVYDFKWCDDFAKAKNFAIDKAAGNWILFPDADEYFPDEAVVKIRPQLEEINDKPVNYLMCRLINIDTDNNNEHKNSFYQVRIFRNLPEIRYSGNIHEALDPMDMGKLMPAPRDVFIYHTGYSSSIIEMKLKRNLQMLKDDIKENGESEIHYKPLADCYFGMGEYEKVVEYDQKMIDTGKRLIGADMEIYLQYITALTLLHKPKAEIEKIVDIGLGKYPESSDLNYQKGDLRYHCNDFLNADKYLQKALKIHETSEELTSSIMDRAVTSLYGLIGDIYLIKNQKGNAIKYYLLALRENNKVAQFFINLLKTVRKRSLKIKVAMINKIYSAEDKDFLLVLLRKCGENDLYFYYKQLYGAKSYDDDRLRADFQCGRYAAAAQNAGALLDKAYKNIMTDTIEKNEDLSSSAKAILPGNYQLAFRQVKAKIGK